MEDNLDISDDIIDLWFGEIKVVLACFRTEAIRAATTARGEIGKKAQGYLRDLDKADTSLKKIYDLKFARNDASPPLG